MQTDFNQMVAETPNLSQRMRSTWPVRGIGASYLIVHRAELGPDETPINRVFAAPDLDRWIADPLCRGAVLDLFHSLNGQLGLSPSRLTLHTLSQCIKPVIEEAFRHGKLALVCNHRSRTTATAARPAAMTPTTVRNAASVPALPQAEQVVPAQVEGLEETFETAPTIAPVEKWHVLFVGVAGTPGEVGSGKAAVSRNSRTEQGLAA